MPESRQLQIARDIDRPEPLREDCETSEQKLHKAHCILLDVLSRINRGIALKGDWENERCVREARELLSEALLGE